MNPRLWTGLKINLPLHILAPLDRDTIIRMAESVTRK